MGPIVADQLVERRVDCLLKLPRLINNYSLKLPSQFVVELHALFPLAVLTKATVLCGIIEKDEQLEVVVCRE